MPARTLSSAGTARGATAAVSKKAAIPTREDKSRPTISKDVKGKKSAVNQDTKTFSSKETTFDGKDDVILSAIKTPTKCTRIVAERLLGLLNSSASELDVTLSEASISIKSNTSGSSSILARKKEACQERVGLADATVPNPKRIHLAKLVVNGAIASLNELVGSGWKVEMNKERSSESVSSRSTSASGTSRSSSSVSSTSIDKSTRPPICTVATESNVASVFDCVRIAVHYLSSTAKGGSLPNTKELELEYIISSIIRKTIAMDMHRLALSELEWLQRQILSHYTKERPSLSFEYTIPTMQISARLRDLILEVQALTLTCTLLQTTTSRIGDLFAAMTQYSGGPLSWQQYVRSTASEDQGMESADRHVYSVERSLTRYLAKESKGTSGIDLDLVLQCRKLSLDFLLLVSDLDQDAFWDRAARIGSSHIRSKTTTASAEMKRSAFLSVDEVFRDLVRRAEQVHLDPTTNSSTILQGKGFTTFCEIWIKLAQKAGEAQAIHHVAGLLSCNNDTIQSVQLLSEEQIEGLVTQSCAKLAQCLISLDELLASGCTEESVLKLAEAEVDSALLLANAANSTALQKVFRVLDQLRRRCLRLLDEKKCKVSQVTTLLLAICKHYEQYLETDTKGQVEDDETILEDYIYVMRSLANFTFAVLDWITHEAAATYLSKCETILKCQQGKMEKISDAVRCNKLRLLSSSWYYIGGQLYNDKKLPLAIRFLKLACETAQTSLELYNSLTIDKKEIVSDLKRPEGIAKKWEHLAVCYRNTSQPRPSLEAFVTGLRSAEQKQWNTIATRASKTAISNLFRQSDKDDEEKGLSDVASMARSAFEVGAFDLLFYSKEGGRDKDWADQLLEDGIPPEAVGALLENCLLSLDSTMHREEAPQAALRIVTLLLELYNPLRMPIRRARVLIQKVELAVMQPQLFNTAKDKEQIESWSQEARKLLSQSELCQDDQLSRFVPQYTTMLSLLLILQEQQNSSASSQRKIVQYSTEAALQLKTLVPPTTISVKRTLKTSTAPREQSVNGAPVTPPRGKKTSSRFNQASVAVTEVQPSLADIDDAPRLWSLVELVLEMVHSSGHLLASIELHNAAKQVAMALVDTLGSDHYLHYSATLIRQHISLGNTGKASKLMTEMTEAIKGDQNITSDTRMRCLFVSARYYCHVGQIEKSEELYHEAVHIASRIETEGRLSSHQSGVNRGLLHERQAMALEMISMIQEARGDPIGALKYAIQSVRSAIKAGLVLSRLTTYEDEQKEESHSPFTVLKKDEGESTVTVTERKPLPRLSSWSVAILHWRLIKILVLAYMRVSCLYRARGSARDAEAFAGEAIEFGQSINVPLLLSTAFIVRGSIRIQSRSLEKGLVDLDQATDMVGVNDNNLEEILLAVERAEYETRCCSMEGALEHHQKAVSILDSLTAQLHQLDPKPPSSKNTKAVSAKSKGQPSTLMLSEIKGKILQKRAWILHLMDQSEDSKKGMNRAASLLVRGADRDIHNVYQGRIEVHQSSKMLKTDQVMGMLPESALSMPMVRSISNQGSPDGSKSLNRGNIGKTASVHLALAQSLFEGVISGNGRFVLDSIALREACLNLAISHTLSSILQGREGGQTSEVVAMLENACGITLQREMLDAIDAKLEGKGAAASIPGWEKEALTRGKESSPAETSEDEEQMNDLLRKKWLQNRQRHAEPINDVDLPQDWTVISINLYRERNCLVLTRRSGDGSTPIVVSLPIDRQSRREGEEEVVGIDTALQELKDIVEESNTTTHSAQHLDGMQARKDWWSKRRELDGRMKSLLEAIEVNWLGAFKSLFLPRTNSSKEDFANLRLSFDAIFQRAFFPSSTGARRTAQVAMDDDILDCFSALSFATFTDEDLEDLIHFAMDAYQFHGLPVAVDEVDLDLCVTDLRGVLEGFRAKHQQPNNIDSDRHLFLLLDKDTCAIPWESIPLLRSQAVCRIPSIAFLQDRLESIQEDQRTKGKFLISTKKKAKVWYLLNPSKDLTRTQERFLPWLESKKGWKGISNRAPILEEMAEALESNDVVLYFGHGGGEQYLRPSKLRGLKKCAITMLWGCSSGVLKDLGDFDRTGTPWNYLMAGCPSLLGNLWDATDKELDGVSESVLEKMGLKDGGTQSSHLSIAQAVAQSRDACKLPYLTGAACVVYGIPVYYQ